MPLRIGQHLLMQIFFRDGGIPVREMWCGRTYVETSTVSRPLGWPCGGASSRSDEHVGTLDWIKIGEWHR